MADISKITLPSGTTYNLKDAQARSDIESLQGLIASGVSFAGTTTTALTDGATTSPITVNSASYTQEKGDLVVYGSSEFLWDGTKWILFGDLGTLKALAFKDSASGSYKPAGTVSKPTFSGTQATIKPKVTAEGTVSTPTITVTPNTTSIQVIDSVGTAPSCTLPTWSGTVSNENLTIGWSAGSFSAGSVPTKKTAQTVVTGIKSATSSQPTFTGTEVEGSATYTPAGSVTQPTFTGTQATIEVS